MWCLGLGIELAGNWWGPGSCSRDSVSSQPACFSISISAVLGEGQGSFPSWVGGALAAGDSCWREGKSQPRAGGNLGSSNSSLAQGPWTSPFISPGLHVLVRKTCPLCPACSDCWSLFKERSLLCQAWLGEEGALFIQELLFSQWPWDVRMSRPFQRLRGEKPMAQSVP